MRYCEVSMKDCFGLSYLHKFFSIPFLQMQVRAFQLTEWVYVKMYVGEAKQ